MKRIFITMLFSLLASLLIFLAVMSVTFLFGFKRSVTGWGVEKRRTIEKQVQKELKEILSQGNLDRKTLLEEKMPLLITNNIYLVIYSKEMEILYTNKDSIPVGKQRMTHSRFQQDHASKLPLEKLDVNGETVGYYSIGSFGFGIDRANTRFLESMKKTVWLSIVFAFVIAFPLAFMVSKRLADSAKVVANGIDKMAHGELSVRIPERGVKEVSTIAKSANELGRKLEREGTLRRQWAADVAHDLKTPIAALKSQLEGMADGVLGMTKDRIERNLKELSRMEVLVNDLGELTRLESPEVKIAPTKIDTENFFQDLNSRFEDQFEGKKISVNWKKEVGTFIGDENLVQRAVSNFISNAIRHTPKGGDISIALRREGKGYMITVFNTGEGIPEDEIDRVFDRLYRGEYARRSPGSGLGLTIAQKIAELHNGKVTIKSSEGYGTTVEMKIDDKSLP